MAVELGGQVSVHRLGMFPVPKDDAKPQPGLEVGTELLVREHPMQKPNPSRDNDVRTEHQGLTPEAPASSPYPIQRSCGRWVASRALRRAHGQAVLGGQSLALCGGLETIDGSLGSGELVALDVRPGRREAVQDRRRDHGEAYPLRVERASPGLGDAKQLGRTSQVAQHVAVPPGGTWL
jgi:hypothetical protein